MNVPADQRFCHFCDNCIEDEVHTIVRCPMYTKVRNDLFTKATYFNNDFIQMPDIDKLIFSFSDKRIVRKCAKTCQSILDIRCRDVAEIQHPKPYEAQDKLHIFAVGLQ